MTRRRGSDHAPAVAAQWARIRPPAVSGGGAPPTALILGDPTACLARALHATGHTVTRWSRHLVDGQHCSSWPPDGPFAEVWVRMPRSSLEAAMLLNAAASRVLDRGQILLYGANGEGIRSASRHFPQGTTVPRPLLVKRRCRVLAARRTAAPPRADGLDSWETRAPVDWGTGEREWTFYPGVFAYGRLDAGTALLIEHLPPVPAGARVLDFGAGTGAIAAAVLERRPTAEVVLLERDIIALAAAARNVAGAARVLGSGLAQAQGSFDLIVSNPPLHIGKAQSLETLEALVRDAPGALSPRGMIALVAQRRLHVPPLLRRSFRRVRTVADRGSFRVWAADGPQR